MKTSSQEARIENVYRLEGRVPVCEGHSLRTAACAGDVRGERRAAHHSPRSPSISGEAFTAIETARLLQNCMLIAGIGTLIAALPHLGDRLGPAGRHGHQLHVPRPPALRRLRRITASWSARSSSAACFEGRAGPDGQVLAQDHLPDRFGLRGRLDRLEHPECRRFVVRLFVGVSARLVAESARRHHHARRRARLPHDAQGLSAKQLYVLLGMVVGYAVVDLLRHGRLCAPWASTIRRARRRRRAAALRVQAAVPARPRIFSFTSGVLSSPPLRRSATRPHCCKGGLGRDITADEISGSLCVRRLRLRASPAACSAARPSRRSARMSASSR